MLRDNVQAAPTPLPNDLNAAANLEIVKIIDFIDENIGDFPDYYKSIKDSDRENRISDNLVHHLQLCKMEKDGGYFPFDFRKNPTQVLSGKETDIGVFIMTRAMKPVPVLEFEAKRFSATSNNQQYVHGAGRGGIERFKRGEHSSLLNVCGMFAYVQQPTKDDWIDKVNGWINDLAVNNKDSTIDWTGKGEPLKKIRFVKSVQKLSSEHIRKQTSDTILIWHYFMDLN